MRLRKMIEWLLRNHPGKIIAGDCPEKYGPLMTRWVLFSCHWFNIVLHRFHRSDIDRAFHDHPWPFVTLLLTAGYWENQPGGRFWRRRFSIHYRPATWQHWVELEYFPVYTLVLRFPEVRQWGFIVDGKWQPWDKVNFEKVCNDA